MRWRKYNLIPVSPAMNVLINSLENQGFFKGRTDGQYRYLIFFPTDTIVDHSPARLD